MTTPERLCECGCGESMEGRSEHARFFADKCRAKMYHDRQRANNPNPPKERTPKAKPKPKAERTPIDPRPDPREEPKGAERTAHVPADRQPVGEPEAIDPATWAAIELESEHTGPKVTDMDVTTYHNNLISNAMAQRESTCRGCQRPGGSPKTGGGAGALRTKMGKPGAYCETCWPKAFPEERE